MYCLVIFDHELPRRGRSISNSITAMIVQVHRFGQTAEWSALRRRQESPGGGLVRRRTWIENTYHRRRPQHIL